MNTSSSKNQYQAYAVATQTVAKTQQIIMLYDGMIRIVQQAKEAITQNRIEDRYNLLVKVSTIIHGMQGCLDFDNGKEMANILYSYYASVDSRVFSIHRTNSIETCDEVIRDLKEMRESWLVVDEETVAKSSGHSAPLPEITQVEQAPAAPVAPIILSA